MHDVCVIIPCFNGPQMLREAITSAVANAVTPFHLVISDDGSRDVAMVEYLERLSHQQYTVLHHEGQRGFPHNVNFAVKQTSEPFICLLNSDTKACTNWLRAMMAEMEDPTVGVVGVKLVYPKNLDAPHANCIQHCGVAFDSSGCPYHIWRGIPKDAPEANQRRELNAVTFACALIRRTSWNEVGGLDEGYVGGQFEDIDFCLASRSLGWKVVYTPKAVLYHREHGSGEDVANKTAEPNLRRLHQKWPKLLSDERLFQPFSWASLREPKVIEEMANMLHAFRVHYWREWETYPLAKLMREIGYYGLTDKEREVLRKQARTMGAMLWETCNKLEEGQDAIGDHPDGGDADGQPATVPVRTDAAEPQGLRGDRVGERKPVVISTHH